MSDDRHNFMKAALEEAERAFSAGEVPVGAVLVHEGKIIARAHNEVEKQQDASCHAEMLCLKRGALSLGNWRLTNTTLYSTLEPCPMCAGALFLFRVQAVVWGAPDIRQGADGSFIDLLRREHPIHKVEVVSGVLQEESSALMRRFFQERRSEKQSLPLFEELIDQQKKKLLACAERIVPRITSEDLLQPNDFPALEYHPHFRYEEGILEGLLTARMALRAAKEEKK